MKSKDYKVPLYRVFQAYSSSHLCPDVLVITVFSLSICVLALE
jgi:hypothetical protein